MDFAGDEAGGDDAAFTVGDFWTDVDGGELSGALDLKLSDVHLQEFAGFDADGFDSSAWTNQFGVDDAAIVAVHGDRNLGPSLLIGRRQAIVVLPRLRVLCWDTSAERDFFDRDQKRRTIGKRDGFGT